MQFYNRFGFEWFGKDSNNRVGWRLDGEFFDEHYWSSKIARALRNNAEFHRVISPAVKIVAELGFEQLSFIECKCRAINVVYISSYCDHIAVVTITDAYDPFMIAHTLDFVIKLSDANIDIEIADNTGECFRPSIYKKKYAKYVQSVPRLRNLYAKYITAFAARLPQPIAEAVAAEFKLVQPHSNSV